MGAYARIICTVTAIGLLPGGPALAQKSRFDPQALRPTGDPESMVSTWTTSVQPHGSFGTTVWLDLGFRPFRLDVPALSLPPEDIVEWRLDLHANLHVGLFNLLVVGVDVPVVVFQAGLDNQFARSTVGFDGLNSALGDMAVWGKLAVGAQRGGLPATSLLVSFSLPTGDSSSLAGEPGLGFEFLGIFDYQIGIHSLSGNLGYRVRTAPVRVRNSEVRGEVLYRLGLLYRFAAPQLAGYPAVVAEIAGSSPAPQASDDGAYGGGNLEARLGLRQRMRGGASPMAFMIAGSVAVLDSASVPLARLVMSVDYVSKDPFQDTDGDLVVDARDGCVTLPEDLDKFQDSDGCPEDDNDGDGILDEDDECPLEAENADGYEDLDGCPEPDLPDDDKDGFFGEEDACPNEAEDFDGFEDLDGCPEADNDKDGLLDLNDLCPDAPEDKNRFEDDDGCPDGGKGRRLITADGARIKFFRPLRFKPGTLELSERSNLVLNQLGALLRNNPHVERLRIIVHPDGRSKNRRIEARNRARVLVDELSKRFVEAYRLQPRAGDYSRRDKGKVEMVITRFTDPNKGRKKRRRKRRRR